MDTVTGIDATPSDGELLERLHDRLDFTGDQMARLLGISRKHVYRLQDQRGRIEGPCGRLLQTLLRCRLSRIEHLLVDLFVDGATGVTTDEIQILASRGRHAMTRDLADVPPTTRVVELLMDPSRPRARKRWIYWASSARADADTTSAIARDHAFICRPLQSSRGVVPTYLEEIRELDEILLVHDGRPQEWFQVRPTRTAEGELEVPHLPPVYCLVHRHGALGALLAANRYPNQQGLDAGSSDEPFSGIRVVPLEENVVPTTLSPKPERIKDTLTPYRPDDHPQPPLRPARRPARRAR